MCVCSSNGTFVGGEKIGELGKERRGVSNVLSYWVAICTLGRDKTRVLNSDDEISLALKKNKGIKE